MVGFGLFAGAYVMYKGLGMYRMVKYMRNADKVTFETPKINLNNQKFLWYMFDDIGMGGKS